MRKIRKFQESISAKTCTIIRHMILNNLQIAFWVFSVMENLAPASSSKLVIVVSIFLEAKESGVLLSLSFAS